MVLDWNHNNARNATMFVFTKVFAPKLGIQTPYKEDKTLESVLNSLDFIENRFLAEHEYVATDVHPTFADL